MKDFYNEKTVVVYGATGGLGKAICQQLQAKKLILAGRNTDKLQALQQSLRENEGKENLEIWQVSSSGSEQNFEQNFAQNCRNAGVDGLIIATGKTIYEPFSAPSRGWQDYQELLEVNLSSVLRLAFELLPYFREKQGFFHISGSYACIFPVPYQAVYAASKAALLSFVQAVGRELESDKGLLSISLIGGMATEMYYQSDLQRQFATQLSFLEPLFIAPPSKIAAALLAGIAQGRQVITIKSSGWWTYHVLRRLPAAWLLWGLNKAYRPKHKN